MKDTLPEGSAESSEISNGIRLNPHSEVPPGMLPQLIGDNEAARQRKSEDKLIKDVLTIALKPVEMDDEAKRIRSAIRRSGFITCGPKTYLDGEIDTLLEQSLECERSSVGHGAQREYEYEFSLTIDRIIIIAPLNDEMCFRGWERRSVYDKKYDQQEYVVLAHHWSGEMDGQMVVILDCEVEA